ncbi:MAG: hypothetical protein JSR18_09025, partial [Proteobacteria bacterium]|nr:hypothetical protein [Pseudomonadota bacterium]
VLSGSGVTADMRWELDGRDVAQGKAEVDWEPTPGAHRLALVDADGRECAAVRFSVRGSMPRLAASAR